MGIEGRRRDVEEQPINPNTSSSESPFAYFRFDKKRDSPDQARSAILVVAALVVSASYQAMMSPPEVFKDKPHRALLVFIYANTLAWSASNTILELLTASLPYQRELRLSYGSMACAYGIVAAIHADLKSSTEYFLLFSCYLIPYIVRLLPMAIKYMCCK
ncbi:uncharacterized protein LOC143623426 [Bidens hawaiensis]|uniref:uncharacterized protein LOC143623426 n=1 Tax=Bidens hawaiensis TaxID=980011 RepID=UPI00404B2FA1